jgi:hypothetical protein
MLVDVVMARRDHWYWSRLGAGGLEKLLSMLIGFEHLAVMVTIQ